MAKDDDVVVDARHHSLEIGARQLRDDLDRREQRKVVTMPTRSKGTSSTTTLRIRSFTCITVIL
ncbi:MAG: hypothetical protein H0T42_30650 [Deltaproteobacteria bacterium]|nr:hypothetical protein [Deltaproteobacteria bacterium]